MLHIIIFIGRSGSTTFSYELANKFNAKLLGEIMHSYRKDDAISYAQKFNDIVSMLISLSHNENVVVKFHIYDILRVFNCSRDNIRQLFQMSTKLYYLIRLDYKTQIISQMIADKTNQWSRNRDTSKVIVLAEEKIPRYTRELIQLLSIQGEWFKKFPGELLILESTGNNPYPKYNFEFKGIKSFLKKKNFDYLTLFQDIDVLTIFNNGNSKYII